MADRKDPDRPHRDICISSPQSQHCYVAPEAETKKYPIGAQNDNRLAKNRFAGELSLEEPAQISRSQRRAAHISVQFRYGPKRGCDWTSEACVTAFL